MIMEKRKPSMVGVPGTPLHTMTLEGQCRMAMTFRPKIWDTFTA